jgi:hypothetical protein
MVKIPRIFQGILVKTEPPVHRALLGFLKITVQRLNRSFGLWFGSGRLRRVNIVDRKPLRGGLGIGWLWPSYWKT